MDYGTLLLLIGTHVIFDFFLQTRDVATQKSSKFKYLLAHLSILMFGLMIFTKLSGRYTPDQAILFVCWNLILHGFIDWYIWRGYKTVINFLLKKGRRDTLLVNGEYRYWEDSMFYNTIAIDQVLHALCYLGLDWIVRSFVV